MIDEKIALRELLEKSPDATFLREMIGFAANRLMELETETLCGGAHGARSEARRNQRNGYRDRDWETRADCVSRSCGAAATSPAFSSRAGRPRKR
jgi:transposase-like protein